MTSATTEPVKGTDRPRGESHGLIVFASVLLVIVGWAVCLRQPREPGHLASAVRSPGSRLAPMVSGGQQ